MINFFKKNKKGFTLIETLIAVSIFAILSMAVYSGFISILKIINVIRVKNIMTNIANEQFEIARNLSYQNVGTINGIPSGVIPQTKTITRDDKIFEINTVVRNIDDPYDGTFNGSPKDLSPADRKLVEINISCESCDSSLSPIYFTTNVAPKNLETASTNGALVVRVFDASGLPVPQADVHIVNNQVSPTIDLNDQTDNYGLLTIVDAPPSVSGYNISVTKDEYSIDKTYPIGGSSNPNPIKPNVTVLVQQISQVSFTIDENSQINFSTINNQCLSTPGFNFDLKGNKLIGINPNTFKYSQSLVTNSLGKLILPNVEWDTYNITGTDLSYDIIGTNPLLSLGINPNVEQNMEIITAPKNGRRLVVVVRDQSTGLPVSDASVTLTGPGNYSKTLITNEGFFNQTDWSGGGGQQSFGNYDMYLDSDGGIDDNSSEGNLSLNKIFGNYVLNGNLTSSTFDAGSISNFKQVLWNPVTQPQETGAHSIRFQIATNNDDATWDFIGPDATSSSYYTSTNQNINAIHNGKQYIRYKLYLSTEDSSFSPMISDIYFTFSSACIPPGQVSFATLSTGIYTILVNKNGYQSISKEVTINNDWSKEEITISQ